MDNDDAMDIAGASSPPPSQSEGKGAVFSLALFCVLKFLGEGVGLTLYPLFALHWR